MRSSSASGAAIPISRLTHAVTRPGAIPTAAAMAPELAGDLLHFSLCRRKHGAIFLEALDGANEQQ